MTPPTTLPLADLNHRIAALRPMLEQRLGELLPRPADASDAIGLAMREGVLSPGKRIRPLMLLLTGQCLEVSPDDLIDAACALEMVHAASLFLDDLPCMDDARERRGRPTLHLQFGEDVTMLAAVAVLSHAYRLVAVSPALPPLVRAGMVDVLARAVGPQGLVRGQFRDLRPGHAPLEAAGVADTNQLKTGSLFSAAFEMAALAGGADAQLQATLAQCAVEIGHAFQLKDDLDDSIAADGSPTGAEDDGKPTLVSLLGREAATQRLDQHLARAQGLLRQAFPHDEGLVQLVRAIARPARAAAAARTEAIATPVAAARAARHGMPLQP